MPKSLSNSQQTISNSQAGVTLLIAVLVMSGLALISLSVGAFAIQELRSSRAVLVTEPAISAAETAGEQSLWAINRGVALTNCPSQTTASLGNGALVNSCKSYSSATFDIVGDIPFVFFLYDPNNINSNVDLLTPPYPYDPMTITHLSGTASVDVYVERLDGNDVGAQPVAFAPGSSGIISLPAVSSGAEGRMKVTLRSTGNATVRVNTNQGLPDFPTILAGGCAARTAVTDCNSATQELFTRKINITVGGGASTSSSWIYCADENGVCTFPGAKQVRYGENGFYYYLNGVNSMPCDNATFGDPIVGTVKHCYYNVSATLPPPPGTWNMTVVKAGTGTGTITGGGINCGATCANSYSGGTQISLAFAADPGSTFSGWSGDCSGTGACNITMNANHSVTATFAIAPPSSWNLTVAKSGTGTGTITGGGINCGATCSNTQSAGAAVSLTATADAGSAFTGWTGDCSGTGACNLTMNANHSVTATFAPTWNLTVAKSGTGTGTVSGNGINCGSTCSNTQSNGAAVSLAAVATSGSTFSGWTGDCAGTGLCLMTMNSNHSVTAVFTLAGPFATGGTVTTSGAYTIHTFTSSGTFTVNRSGSVEYLVVAGGGGGGPDASGGGGGGGVLASSVGVTAQGYTVTVGAGGARTTVNYSRGFVGGNSAFGAITATGGGGGGSNAFSGGVGGSGGGGGWSGNPPGGAGTGGQGFNGGTGFGTGGCCNTEGGGGGGGAGGAGANGGNGYGGNGGNGVASSISGASVYYGGGGGGNQGWNGFGTGGLGGGGNGSQVTAQNGVDNRGGGGGGATNGAPGATGGNGGSGIVIIRYLTSQ